MLETAGVTIERSTQTQFGYNYGPKILIDPMYALTLQDLRERFKGTNTIKQHTSLVLMNEKLSF